MPSCTPWGAGTPGLEPLVYVIDNFLLLFVNLYNYIMYASGIHIHEETTFEAKLNEMYLAPLQFSHILLAHIDSASVQYGKGSRAERMEKEKMPNFKDVVVYRWEKL